MQVVILAAGFCTRLFPITQYYPKALLPIDGKAILSYALDQVVRMRDVKKITLVTNKRYYPIFSVWWKIQYPNRKATILDNGVVEPDERLGAIGDLLFAVRKLRINDDVLVLSSDVISSLKLSDFVAFSRKNGGFTNATCDMHDASAIAGKLGCLEVKGSRIVGFEEKPEKPKTTLTSIPFYWYPRQTLPFLDVYRKDGGSLDAPGSIVPFLMSHGSCFAYVLKSGYYYDVGTVDMYNKLAGKPDEYIKTRKPYGTAPERREILCFPVSPELK